MLIALTLVVQAHAHAGSAAKRLTGALRTGQGREGLLRRKRQREGNALNRNISSSSYAYSFRSSIPLHCGICNYTLAFNNRQSVPLERISPNKRVPPPPSGLVPAFCCRLMPLPG